MRPDTLPGRLTEDEIVARLGITHDEYHDIWFRLVGSRAERHRSMINFLPMPMTMVRRGALADLLQIIASGAEWPPAPVRFWQGRFFEHHFKIIPSKQERGG